jgi:hypothetical protein
MVTALRAIDAFVQKSYLKGGIDGLVVAIVTREGVVYETAIGPLKANETEADKRGAVDRHSIFRIASGSKLFATLETLILREKGALQWSVFASNRLQPLIPEWDLLGTIRWINSCPSFPILQVDGDIRKTVGSLQGL